jgi:hypothetical protein
MGNVMRYIVFLLLISFGDIFCVQPTVSSNMRTFIRTLNAKLKIVPLPRQTSSPIFIITVTRISNGKTPKIHQEKLDKILDELSILCNGTRFVNTHVGALPHGMPVPALSPADIRSIQKIHNDNSMGNCAKIIIFNEMFFSQLVPLQFAEKQAIEMILKDVSNNNPRLLLCPNFLFLDNIRNVAKVNMQEIFNKTVDSINNGSMQIDGASHRGIRAKIRNMNTNLTGLIAAYNITPLINESICIHNGNVLTKYLKSTYFQEADNDLIDTSKECWYLFGNGVDSRVTNNELSKFLHSNVSFEICFDLANGIRIASRNTSKLHIIQSNWIDATEYQNQNNLQINKLIIHVDPIATLDNVNKNEIKKFGNTLSRKTFDTKGEHLTEKVAEVTIELGDPDDRVVATIYKLSDTFKR